MVHFQLLNELGFLLKVMKFNDFLLTIHKCWPSILLQNTPYHLLKRFSLETMRTLQEAESSQFYTQIMRLSMKKGYMMQRIYQRKRKFIVAFNYKITVHTHNIMLMLLLPINSSNFEFMLCLAKLAQTF